MENYKHKRRRNRYSETYGNVYQWADWLYSVYSGLPQVAERITLDAADFYPRFLKITLKLLENFPKDYLSFRLHN